MFKFSSIYSLKPPSARDIILRLHVQYVDKKKRITYWDHGNRLIHVREKCPLCRIDLLTRSQHETTHFFNLYINSVSNWLWKLFGLMQF